MRWLLRILIGGGIAVALLLLLLAGGVYFGSQVEPEFYHQALQTAPEDLEQESEELLAKTTALVSLARQEGSWEAVFTESQINGWLAVDLPEKHKELLPPDVHDPRVVIQPDRAKVAWRWDRDRFTTVVSLDLEIFLSKPDELAIRIRRIRAGAVPLPTAQLLDLIGKRAEEAKLHIRWVQEDGDPVALVPIPPVEDGRLLRRIKAIRLEEGQVYLAGETQAADDTTQDPVLRVPPGIARQAEENAKSQR